jgi:3-oxoacyl-[acyl-carrier protein] reductase
MGSSASRVAVVTGGSGGVGRRTAERLGAEDMAVVTGFAGNPAASIWLHESAP